MVVGGGTQRTGPAQATLFRSHDPNLAVWAKQPQPLFATARTAWNATTDFFECPDIFTLPDHAAGGVKFVFLASLWQSSDPAWFGAPTQHNQVLTSAALPI